MNLIDVLKKCEGNVSEIARDCGVTRATPGLWVDNRLPSKEVFEKLQNHPKYASRLDGMNYDELRKKRPIGRPPISGAAA